MLDRVVKQLTNIGGFLLPVLVVFLIARMLEKRGIFSAIGLPGS